VATLQYGDALVLAKTEVNLYCASLDLRGVPVLVVGGGEVALRKIESLLEAHARVTVIAPQFHEALVALPAQGDGGARLRRTRRKFRATDLQNYKMIFAVTDDAELNQSIARSARRLGALVNVATPGEAGNFQVPATVRRGALSIAISTGGASAELARSLRERIEKVVGPEWGVFVALLMERRARVIAAISDAAERRSVLKKLGATRWLNVIRKHGAERAGQEMDLLIDGSARVAQASSLHGLMSATRRQDACGTKTRRQDASATLKKAGR